MLRAHIKGEQTPQLCIHYDPNQVSLAVVKRIAEQSGNDFTQRYRYEQLLFAHMDAGDWTVFTNVLSHDAIGRQQLVAGYASRPGAGCLPTNRWLAGWRILDEYQIQLPADLKGVARRLIVYKV